MSLYRRLFIIFLTIAMLPTILFTLFTYNRYTYFLNTQNEELTTNISKKAATEANLSLQNLSKLQSAFNFDTENQQSIIEELKKYKVESSYTNLDVWESNEKIKYLCQIELNTYSFVNGIFIFTPSGEVLGYGNGIEVSPTYSPYSDEWYQATLQSNGNFYTDGNTKKDFLLGADSSISFSSCIYDLPSDDLLGILFIDCSADFFDLSHVNTIPDSTYMTIKKNDCLLYETGTPIESSSSILQHTTSLDADNMVLTIFFDLSNLTSEFQVTKYLLFFMTLFCLVLVIVLSLILSRDITTPIHLLSQKMSSKDHSDLIGYESYLARKDEIGVLYNEYQRMIEELDHYIKEELQNKLITLNSQMRSLEAQINAHFLYNTLEGISSLGAIEGISDISIMAEALSDMFRYSIKTQSELVPLNEELTHVKNYIAIQQILFDYGFEFTIELEESLLHLKVLKLILQPIVENALYHGLLSCNCGSQITLSGFINNNCLYLVVSDDGTGITKEKLAALQESLEEPLTYTELGYQNKNSIGVKNIHSRICLYYGTGFGIQIKSELNKGSTFTIAVPVIN